MASWPWNLLTTRLLLLSLAINTTFGQDYNSREIWNSKYSKKRDGSTLLKRQPSTTEICRRWALQTAVVNGTLYIYGGRIFKEFSQSFYTWSNDFLSLDLKRNWDVSSPGISKLTTPSGTPAVANGYLWNSYTSLFLYGGRFSDNSTRVPDEFSLWEFDLVSRRWKEHRDPKTSKGNKSDKNDKMIERVANGSGVSLPDLGRGWYFGGYIDGYTTKTLPIGAPRVYLKSMIEYTFPGSANGQVDMKGNAVAGSSGVWRNITGGGLQDSARFNERANGILVYVPGFGKEGILLGFAGGTNTSSIALNVIDIYDIATSTWHTQATSGNTPGIRLNACAVAASAADGSSTQVYLYGGQSIGQQQKEYDDMWILTIPSFTWLEVNMTGQSIPSPRAGHTCSIWNSQIIVTGGQSSDSSSCDTKNWVHVFDASELKWRYDYVALDGGNDLNKQNFQKNKKGSLGGSYGYKVPNVVQSIIGGDSNGKATVTAPVIRPKGGPMATGRPTIYTPEGTVQDNGPNMLNIAAIVVGVIAGCLAILTAYLGFCIYVYRKQIALYKKHVAAAQRESNGARYDDKLSYLGSRDNLGTADFSRGGSSGGLTVDYMYRSTYTPTASEYSQGARRGSAHSSTDDLISGQEPTFLGVMLNPRRNLRVMNL
ncbi:hypothetical protein LOZ53_005969 [Ophidiomyces ophidiicola]|nr:hypothetical protein LOZ55_006460 [Ophidiomyces ophidiicola]KAI1982902.1 hypothetical protein LOZ54_005200 [Ophidiomyces ophidiicola]KAI1983192.1 hypothetical protein LOZ53_005969 [Ophidiomyces ophidiicola]KAI1988013.1 hypothetical protein LOZ51_005492 [Ophidiomyces ophidiicola]